jgi:hypothetical protein
VETLVDYILATGDFTDPETRLPFTDKDLKEIDELVRHRSDSFYYFEPSFFVVDVYCYYYY